MIHRAVSLVGGKWRKQFRGGELGSLFIYLFMLSQQTQKQRMHMASMRRTVSCTKDTHRSQVESECGWSRNPHPLADPLILS